MRTSSRPTTAGHRFGRACDVVPTGDSLGFEERKADAFIQHLRTETSNWTSKLSKTEIDALEAFLKSEDLANVRVFSGSYSGEACAGSGTTSYYLVFNTKTNNALYLVLYPYSE